MTLIAQISDLHLDGTARTSERAARTMAYLTSLPTPVDALLVTGDIADHGATPSTARRPSSSTSRSPS